MTKRSTREMSAEAESYLRNIVDQTISDFEKHPTSRRHAFLACLVTFHCIDYLAFPGKSGNLRKQFKNESMDFALVDRVTHAFKHVESGSPESAQNRPLRVAAVFERPPRRAGIMQAGLSRLGDPVGGVGIWVRMVKTYLT